MESEEFKYLKDSVETRKARIVINRFFMRKALSLWFIYKNNQKLLWLYSLLWFLTSEWFCVPFSIFLAWKFKAWWLVIIGIAFSWVADEVIKFITYYFLPESLIKDENLFDYFWKQNSPYISIQSIKEEWDGDLKKKMPVIMVIPPASWREASFKI